MNKWINKMTKREMLEFIQKTMPYRKMPSLRYKTWAKVKEVFDIAKEEVALGLT